MITLNGGTAAQFDKFKAVSPINCSVANWECVRATSYIYTNTPLSNAQAIAYNADGFELGQHINTGCADWASTPALESFYSDQLDSWATKYLGVPRPSTNRTHCVVWSDFATQPLVELNHGIRLDTNYYYYPTNWVQNRPASSLAPEFQCALRISTGQ
jgi:hypothetical protein